MSISTIVLTKNEEKNIEACLESLAWCDEILVIDDKSTDATVENAKKHKAIVVERDLENDFATQRNFGQEKAKGEWILFIDADERVSKALASEIQRRTTNDERRTIGYFLKREDFMWGKVLRHGEQGQGMFLRLVQKGKGKWVGKVHELLNVAGPTAVLANPIQHFPHPTIGEFLQEINFYSTLRAEELFEKGVKVHWWDIILYPRAKFLQDYLFKLGFLDGIEGFIAALLMSFHSFLVRGKLWVLIKK
ncbi:MAG TPA: glycosyltransferase family 2 protein [Candidatus Eisenbacteria bacterium]|nr:glycosyltransferase family 2 protein [Candidatus Eisenbacteria bacterium]